MQQGGVSFLIDLHFAFDHRNSRAFHPTAHFEDGAFDGNQAIGRGDFETSAALLGGFDHYRAALEMHGLAAPALSNSQIATLRHFEARSVAQSDYGSRAFRCADFVVFVDRSARG